mgnify:CR=1 FL=1
MKNYVTAITLGLLFVFGNAFSQKSIVIKGQLKKVEDGTKIWLTKQEGNVGIGVAKDSVVNGRFSITYVPETEEIEQYSLSPDGKGFPSMSLKLWAKSGSVIAVEGDDKLVYTWNVKSDIPQQNEWAYFINANRQLWNQYQKLSVQRSALLDKSSKGDITKTEKEHLRKSMNSLDSLSNICHYEIDKNNLAILQKRKITPASLEILSNVASSIKWNATEEFRPAVQKLYSQLNEEMKSSSDGQMIALVLSPPNIVRVGEPLYDTLLKDLNGKSYHLADFKGRYVLLDFWSYGCGPCHASVPEMKELHEKFKDSLTIVSISSDNKKIWKKATEYFKMTWLNVSDGNENRGIYAHYGVQGIPNYVLIAPDGIVKATWTGYGTGSLKNKIKEQIGWSISTGND